MHIQLSKLRLTQTDRVLAWGGGILVALPFATTVAMAQSESVLYNFPSSSGAYARPWEDNTGAFYAPTYYGNQSGTVIKISENHGQWKGHIIFDFVGSNGKNPAAGVISDPNGVLYGTTQNGGAYGYGTVYSLASVNGIWTETVLHNFTGGADGGQPGINVVRDKATGTLFGSAPSGGGHSGCGTAFSLVPSGGNWTFNILYSFAGGSDGCNPGSAIHGGPQKGTYFSTTFSGGARNAGTVYELAEKNGIWSESVVHSFTGKDGSMPEDLDIDPDTGTMYGVTAAGGSHRSGAVFELSKTGHSWKYSTLFSFNGGVNGDVPVGLHLEKATGLLYGTTEFGGNYGYGTFFKLQQNGAYWYQSVLHSFGPSGNDGAYPESRPTEDPDTGILYGTTANGGQYGGGTFYSITP